MHHDAGAEWYDRVWGARRDYRADVTTLTTIIREREPDAERLLDIACGTGRHLRYFSDQFTCAGIDVSQPSLEIAAANLPPEVALNHADMRTFDLGERFDAFTDPGEVTITIDDADQPVITVIDATSRDGEVCRLRRLYVVASPGDIVQVEEHHDLGLFTTGEYVGAFEAAGLEVEWLPRGLTDRGLLVATGPSL